MHTFTSIYLHVVFATWNRRPFLTSDLRPRVFAYIAATARNLQVADVHVGGHDDHVHLLGRFDPVRAPSDVVRQLKQAASCWLRDERIEGCRWQRGFGAFSVSRDRVPGVVRYIQRQEDHHQTRSFRDELEKLLREHGVSIDEVNLL